MNAKILSIILASSLMVGCSSFNLFDSTEPIEVQTTAVEKISLNLPELKPLEPEKIEWFIITPENADKILKKLEEENYSIVLYGITDVSYENLSTNLLELRNYILEQKAIIKAYKEYYEPSEKE